MRCETGIFVYWFLCIWFYWRHVYIAKRRPRNVTRAKLDTRQWRTKLYSVRGVGKSVAEELAWIPAKSFHLFRVDRTVCRFPLASSPSARRGNPAWPQHQNVGKCGSECTGFMTRDWTEKGLLGWSRRCCIQHTAWLSAIPFLVHTY